MLAADVTLTAFSCNPLVATSTHTPLKTKDKLATFKTIVPHTGDQLQLVQVFAATGSTWSHSDHTLTCLLCKC